MSKYTKEVRWRVKKTIWSYDKMTKTVEALLIIVRQSLLTLTADERVKFFQHLNEEFCPHCGSIDIPCHCENDE